MTAFSRTTMSVAPPVPPLGGVSDQPPHVGGRLVHALVKVIRWSPLLWLGGLLYPGLAALLVAIACKRWPRPALLSLICCLWIGVGVAQAIASLLNGIVVGDLALGLRNAVSFTVLGWLIAGLAMAVGASSGYRGERLAAMVNPLAVYTLVLGVPALLLSWSGVPEMAFTTPVQMLAGGGEAVRFYTQALFFVRESTLSEVTTRLCLMYPWAPALGIGSVGLGLICSRVGHRGWRWAGWAGSALGVVFSWGRLAMGCALAVAALMLLLRLPAWVRAVAVLVGGCLLLLAYLNGFDAVGSVVDTQAAVGAARSGSSMARSLIYEASWAGFLNSPWIGNGWVGESVHPIEHLPIGSHSTVFGLLYTGGVPVFSAFVAAMSVTLAAIGIAALNTRDPEHRKDLAVAFCLWTVLCLASFYESLYSLTLPCFFFFVWIGATLAHRPAIARAGVAAHASARASFPSLP
jgi:hypothetical protein